MRGGAIPLVAWFVLLLVLMVINWIWEGTSIHVALWGYSLVVILLFTIVLIVRGRDALSKGPPEMRNEPEAVPRVSLASAGAGMSVGLILFGVVFGKFLVFIGGGLLVLCLGRLGRELIWQARSLSAYRRREAAMRLPTTVGNGKDDQ